MFGTWHPTQVESSETDASPAASVSRTQSRLGSASARPMRAARCLVRGCDWCRGGHGRSISPLAQQRKCLRSRAPAIGSRSERARARSLPRATARACRRRCRSSAPEGESDAPQPEQAAPVADGGAGGGGCVAVAAMGGAGARAPARASGGARAARAARCRVRSPSRSRARHRGHALLQRRAALGARDPGCVLDRGLALRAAPRHERVHGAAERTPGGVAGDELAAGRARVLEGRHRGSSARSGGGESSHAHPGVPPPRAAPPAASTSPAASATSASCAVRPGHAAASSRQAACHEMRSSRAAFQLASSRWTRRAT